MRQRDAELGLEPQELSLEKPPTDLKLVPHPPPARIVEDKEQEAAMAAEKQQQVSQVSEAMEASQAASKKAAQAVDTAAKAEEKLRAQAHEVTLRRRELDGFQQAFHRATGMEVIELRKLMAYKDAKMQALAGSVTLLELEVRKLRKNAGEAVRASEQASQAGNARI